MFFSSKDDIISDQIAEIKILWQEAKVQMRLFTVKDLKAYNRKVRYPIISEEIRTLLGKLLYLYEELFDRIVDEDRDEMKAEQEKCTRQEGEIKDYLV